MHQIITYSKYELPKVFIRNGQECFFDPIRKKLILITPEEMVRQQVIQFLIKDMQVPTEYIEVEVPMSYFKKDLKGRADIIVYGEQDNELIPVLILECKANHVPLTENIFNQVIRYDEMIFADMIMVTNGIETIFQAYCESTKLYQTLAITPSYKGLVERQNLQIVQGRMNELWERPSFYGNYSAQVVEEFKDWGWIGEDTPSQSHDFIVNFMGLLQDQRYLLRSQSFNDVNLIEDGGLRYMSYGNAAGGGFTGYYRYFIVEDSEGNHQMVSMSVFATVKTNDDPVFKTRKGIIYLVVAIDDFDKSHNSLQLSIDKYVSIEETKCTIWHDGALTAGKKGAVKKDKVIQFIKQRAPELVSEENQIMLGVLDHSREFKWKHRDVKLFVANLIKYAILRDEFRKEYIYATS
ncbi:type I restriction enzyme HsdR N-terminal domain-containing protein [Bacillus manliponensis]|nr:type I restriction enzyme HsdR N-terminal domain-containing protein [Bacillus manliponensis]